MAGRDIGVVKSGNRRTSFVNVTVFELFRSGSLKQLSFCLGLLFFWKKKIHSRLDFHHHLTSFVHVVFTQYEKRRLLFRSGHRHWPLKGKVKNIPFG